MELKYFELAESEQQAADHWNNSQYDLSDVILCMTDHGMKEGVAFYDLLKTEESLFFASRFMFNFKYAKEVLGINGEYVDRNADITSPEFNPKRNFSVLVYNYDELKEKVTQMFEDITKELKYLKKQVEKQRPTNL